MKVILSAWIASCIMLTLVMITSSEGSAASAPKGLVVQFSKEDLSSVERAIQDSLEGGPVEGRSDTPLRTPYSLGVITARGVSYEFYPDFERLDLLSGAFSFDLSIRQLRGQIDRVEFNDSGSMYCKNIPVRSGSKGGRGTIPVHVVAHPRTLPDGSVVLDVPVSDIGLDERNFVVSEPEECDVIYGFNWLLKWMLPNLIGSYKHEISKGLSETLATTLRDRVIAFSPLMTLRVTLPFEPGTIPSFYATIGVTPSAFDVSPERMQTFFATDITIDPDKVSPFSEENLWPGNLSLVGIDWDFMNAMFREAASKNILRTAITPDGRLGRSWTSNIRWRPIWPDFDAIVGSDARLNLEIAGGDQYTWSSPDARSGRLRMKGMRATLRNDHETLAVMTADTSLDVTLQSGESGEIKAIIQDLRVEPSSVMIQTDGGKLQNAPVNPDGVRTLVDALRGDVHQAPESRREIFNVVIPSLRVGDHQVLIRDIRSSPAGIILPLRYVVPQ